MRAVILAACLLLAACAKPEPPPLPIVPRLPCAPPVDIMVRVPGPLSVPRDVTTLREAVQLWVRDRADFRRTADILTDLQTWVTTRCQ